MSDFEKLINASDLIEWVMETNPDWCVGAVRSIVDHVEDMPSAQPEKRTEERTETHGVCLNARRYTFGNDEFSLEAAYHDCKFVFDGITDDDSFQEADTGLLLYYANEIIYALQEALKGKDANVPSKDTIYRQDAIDALDGEVTVTGRANVEAVRGYARLVVDRLKRLPSAQPERKMGKWTEKHHAYSDEESIIEEWQSCRCSECGRYDTRPYMYYFSEPNYCSYCGADMRGEKDG